jgi:hypothetical protein
MEHFKNFKIVLVASNVSSTGGPPQERKTQRIRSLELPASEIAAQNHFSQSLSKQTSQHQLFRGDCVNQACCKETNTKGHQ